MLEIDNQMYEIINNKIYIGEFTKNGEQGYNICIYIEFVNTNKEKGYINLDAGFEKDNNLDLFTNRKYCGVPLEDENDCIYFEVYDTKKFLDSEINSAIKIEIKDIKNNKIKTSINLDDELIKIKYSGYLDIENK